MARISRHREAGEIVEGMVEGEPMRPKEENLKEAKRKEKR